MARIFALQKMSRPRAPPVKAFMSGEAVRTMQALGLAVTPDVSHLLHPEHNHRTPYRLLVVGVNCNGRKAAVAIASIFYSRQHTYFTHRRKGLLDVSIRFVRNGSHVHFATKPWAVTPAEISYHVVQVKWILCA